MRKLVVLLLLVVSAAAQARDVTSSLGYKATVPDKWIVLTREEIRDNPDLLDLDKAQGSMPKGLLDQVKPMIQSGKVDIFFRPGDSSEFADNVNIMKQMGKLPTDRAGADQVCQAVKQELATAVGRALPFHTCELRRPGNRNALYMDFDGVVQGTRSLQYQVQRSDNVLYVITATAKNGSVAAMRPEFDRMVNTMKFQ
jgi:hypothetical protein